MFNLAKELKQLGESTLRRKVSEKRDELRVIRFFGQSNGRDEVDSLTTSEESFAARDLREARQLFYTHNIQGLIMAQANKQRKGKVRCLVRVLSTSHPELIVQSPRCLSVRSRPFTFDKIFATGRECSAELLRESLVSSIRYAIVGGNAVIIPIGGGGMGKTPLLTYQAETALAWSLEVLKQYPRIKMRLSVIEASDRLVDLINPDKPEVYELEDPLMGPKLSGHSEMLIRSALPGLRLLRRCFTRRKGTAHMLVTLTFHLPNGATGKLHLLDCGRGGSAILSSISPFILGAHHNHHHQSQSPLQTILRESLSSLTSDICLIPHVDGELDKTLAVLQAVARMHRARSNPKKRHHQVTDCRSPLAAYSDVTATSEASHETVVYVGDERAKKVSKSRGYCSDREYNVHITPVLKYSTDYDSVGDLHGVAKSTSMSDLPLPVKNMTKKPNRIMLSDQELSGVESTHEDIIVKCRPRIQPKTYANRRALPLMSETEDEGVRAARRKMETIREYPATDTEAVRQPISRGVRHRPKDNIRLVQMYDGSFQLETGNSRTTLVDSSASINQHRLKKSSSIKNMLGFKKSKSSTTLTSPHSSPESQPTSKVFENGEMTMILPKHYLSEDDLIRQCEEMRAKYKQLVSRLPKKHRKKHEWSNWEYKSYTSDYLLRLEIETRRLESVINQKVIKTGSTRNFSFFGLRIGI